MLYDIDKCGMDNIMVDGILSQLHRLVNYITMIREVVMKTTSQIFYNIVLNTMSRIKTI